MILLNGTSSAGKSSVARELCNTLPDCKYFHADKDLQGQDLLRVVRNASFNHQYVVFDSKCYGPLKSAFPFIDRDVCFVLVYCPLDKLLSHVIKRNSFGISQDYRTFQLALCQFFHMYQLEEDKNLCLDQIAWKKFLQICDNLENKKNKFEIVDYCKRKFLHQGIIQFKPYYLYDLIINTGIYSSQKCAQQIIEYIQNNNNFTALKQSYEKYKDIE